MSDLADENDEQYRARTERAIASLLPKDRRGDAASVEKACWARAQETVRAVEKARPAATSTVAARSELRRAAYAQVCRSSIANLSDDARVRNGNDRLRSEIAAGRVKAGDVPRMTPDELTPDAGRSVARRCRAKPEAVASDAFECPVCSARKCVHYELQTRSADEATTIFVTCVACGHRWTE